MNLESKLMSIVQKTGRRSSATPLFARNGSVSRCKARSSVEPPPRRGLCPLSCLPSLAECFAVTSSDPVAWVDVQWSQGLLSSLMTSPPEMWQLAQLLRDGDDAFFEFCETQKPLALHV